ncbi:MAG TPA: cohesin domain-containing protein [Acidobacteriota bacterium]|nr:cohesin domain-containing protein [Acidobacteriota bacterium]
MKKLLLLTAIGFGLTGGFAQAQSSISVANVNAPPGSKVMVPISIRGGESASAIQFTVNFEPAFLSLAEAQPLRGSSLVDHAVGFNHNEGSLTFVIFSGSLSTFAPGNGSLASVILEVSNGAANGVTLPLSVTDAEGADADGFSVTVIGSDGSIGIGGENNLPVEGENELIFPQVANGSYPGGSFTADLVFVNRIDTTSTGEIRFYKSDGTPFVLSLTDGRRDSGFGFTLPPGGSAFLATDGNGDLSPGYARLSSTAPLGGTLLITSRDAGGAVLSEAGVGASPAARHFSVPIIFERGISNTGIAFANASQETSAVMLVLKDFSGDELASRSISLAPGEHRARFADELFDALDTYDEFQGSIETQSSVALSAIALKLQGALLTTFPIVVLP